MRLLLILAAGVTIGALPFASVPTSWFIFTNFDGADEIRSAIADGISRAAAPSAIEATSDDRAR